MSDASPPTAPVKPGDVLAGKYEVERVIGVGGMGVVVAARHVDLDEKVALKFLLPHAVGSEEVVARFLREARAAAKLKSEHVARVSDVGKLDDGAPYMVMEFLEGSDVAEYLAKRGPLPVDEAVDVLLEACEALAEAHARGIVHRDLKPANLFLANRPGGQRIVKVLDFGISKMTEAIAGKGAGVTRTQAVVGSPSYMSPEQLKSSKDVDARADLWALGVTLYEMLTARLPFEAETMPLLCAMILTEAPKSPAIHRTDLPEGLVAAILRCLEREPSARFSSIGDLAAALAPFGTRSAERSLEKIALLLDAAPNSMPLVRPMRSSPSISVPEITASGRVVNPQAETVAVFASTTDTPRKFPVLAVVGAIAVAVGALGAVLVVPKLRSSTTPVAATNEVPHSEPARADEKETAAAPAPHPPSAPVAAPESTSIARVASPHASSASSSSAAKDAKAAKAGAPRTKDEAEATPSEAELQAALGDDKPEAKAHEHKAEAKPAPAKPEKAPPPKPPPQDDLYGSQR